MGLGTGIGRSIGSCIGIGTASGLDLGLGAGRSTGISMGAGRCFGIGLRKSGERGRGARKCVSMCTCIWNIAKEFRTDSNIIQFDDIVWTARITKPEGCHLAKR